MPKKKSSSSRNRGGDTISISGSSNVNVIKGSGTATNTNIVNEANSNRELIKWRNEMERKIDALKDMPDEDKSTLNQQVEQIAREAEKGPQADPRRLERLFNTISAMGPDIFEVAVATVSNPLAGIGLVVKKIGDKVQVQKG